MKENITINEGCRMTCEFPILGLVGTLPNINDKVQVGEDEDEWTVVSVGKPTWNSKLKCETVIIEMEQ